MHVFECAKSQLPHRMLADPREQCVPQLVEADGHNTHDIETNHQHDRCEQHGGQPPDILRNAIESISRKLEKEWNNGRDKFGNDEEKRCIKDPQFQIRAV